MSLQSCFSHLFHILTPILAILALTRSLHRASIRSEPNQSRACAFAKETLSFFKINPQSFLVQKKFQIGPLYIFLANKSLESCFSHIFQILTPILAILALTRSLHRASVRSEPNQSRPGAFAKETLSFFKINPQSFLVQKKFQRGPF